MIISISSKMSGGKDLTASIIQYLVASSSIEHDYLQSEKDFKSYMDNKHNLRSNWTIKKWADKLKDIVCLLLNSTREQLEDREFKEKELGEEWWYYRAKLTNHLLSISDFDKIEDVSKGFLFHVYELIKPTPRLLLQLLGTECGRMILHPNLWVNSLISEYKPKYKCDVWEDTHPDVIGPYLHLKCKKCNKSYHGYKLQSYCKDCVKDDIYPNFIITDTRFPNELEAVKKLNGITIKIHRPVDLRLPHLWDLYPNKELLIEPNEDQFMDWLKSYNIDLYNKYNHESETALDNAKFDYVIKNVGDINYLIEEVKTILVKEGIIK